MTVFDRYLTGRLLVQFGFFALVLVAVYWVNRAIRLFDRLLSDGSSVTIFLEFTMLALPGVILSVLPVAALVAALYGLNRLAADSELIVAQTAGLGPWRLAKPVGVFGIAVAAMVAVLAHGLVPASRTALADRGREVREDVTARLLQEGKFLHLGPGITVYVREVSPEGEMLGLYLQDRREAGSHTAYTAERAFLVRGAESPRLVMLRGMAQTLALADRTLLTVRFDDFAFDMAGLAGGTNARAPDARELSTPALLRAAPETRALTRSSAAELLQEGHSRLAASLLAAALPLMALGAMLTGAYSRLGLWRQILGAVALAVVAQLLSNAAESAARDDAGLWWTLYLPGAAMLAAGTVLLWLASGGRRAARGLRAAEAAA
ncbi:LPS export ABC transporter permease LptF [Jannaschia sp. Os4]|uniref:LPS export ABC transporter permease LptF n=1 Tax=Jannaschia sp. Os4 TaxID=2807617 RepID=UPI00193A2E2F|nr:LPS export ABC transporter permease LptF [Jannaschia sp. Os4]